MKDVWNYGKKERKIYLRSVLWLLLVLAK
jgi:hypothetical protein